MNNNKFIFDVETTGLPIRGKGINRKLNYNDLTSFDGCRIVSISWILIHDNENEKNAILDKGNYYVKPDRFEVPQESINIHGLTLDILNEKGITIHTIFQELLNMFTNKYNITEIISHNIDFDINVLKSELYRYNNITLLEKIENTSTYCTMLNAQRKMGVGKWPKLREAYIYYYNKDITNAHQAEYDTLYCYEIYKALVK